MDRNFARGRRRIIPLAIGLLVLIVGTTLGGSSLSRPRPADGIAQPAPVVTTRPLVPLTVGTRVPQSIDATGISDASVDLAAFIATVPDGSTILFGADGTYRLDTGIRLTGRRDLVFEGNGSTLRSTGCDSRSSPFELADENDGITIRNFNLVGGNLEGGTDAAYEPGCEFQAGIAIYQSTNIDISHVRIANVSGDCLYVDGGGPSYKWSENVHFRDSACEDNGRMGVAILAARRVTIERVSFDRLAFFVLDIEPYFASGGGIDIIFRENRIGTYGLSPFLTPYFFAADGEPGSTISDVVVTRNVVTGGELSIDVSVARRQNIVVTDNISMVAADGPVMTFAYVDRLTLSGNVQPLRSGGGIFTIRDSTGVVIE